MFISFSVCNIGLTEESAATAELFYAMYKYNDLPPYFHPHTLSYRTNHAHSKDNHAALLLQLRAHNWTDPPDQELYAHARAIFYGRCAAYKIPTVHIGDTHRPPHTGLDKP
jgi:hypothetical protein